MQIHKILFPQPFGLESNDGQPQEALFQCMKLNFSPKIRFLHAAKDKNTYKHKCTQIHTYTISWSLLPRNLYNHNGRYTYMQWDVNIQKCIRHIAYLQGNLFLTIML